MELPRASSLSVLHAHKGGACAAAARATDALADAAVRGVRISVDQCADGRMLSANYAQHTVFTDRPAVVRTRAPPSQQLSAATSAQLRHGVELSCAASDNFAGTRTASGSVFLALPGGAGVELSLSDCCGERETLWKVTSAPRRGSGGDAGLSHAVTVCLPGGGPRSVALRSTHKQGPRTQHTSLRWAGRQLRLSHEQQFRAPRQERDAAAQAAQDGGGEVCARRRGVRAGDSRVLAQHTLGGRLELEARGTLLLGAATALRASARGAMHKPLKASLKLSQRLEQLGEVSLSLQRRGDGAVHVVLATKGKHSRSAGAAARDGGGAPAGTASAEGHTFTASLAWNAKEGPALEVEASGALKLVVSARHAGVFAELMTEDFAA